jgi:hypothetical protein
MIALGSESMHSAHGSLELPDHLPLSTSGQMHSICPNAEIYLRIELAAIDYPENRSIR